jgi:hypothetical protein
MTNDRSEARPALGIFREFHVRLQFHQRKNFLRHYVPGSVRVSRRRRLTFRVLHRGLRRLLRRRCSLPENWIDHRNQTSHKANA